MLRAENLPVPATSLVMENPNVPVPPPRPDKLLFFEEVSVEGVNLDMVTAGFM